ncbi:MAG: hypothetical protein KatS3mg036_0798 [Ignavibacterium sp.]|uniref:hypothetical protein n=1 Tax=Ignavibacterium sp. TaxID=2651167 RepID=UPI0021DDFE8C|nr:hypothetical protein [Ignavibacterium sp.]BDQ01627.1 MAG: hypothetical protein KatS3mg037_0202 [Ignavibacterium sp.]GIV45963.1 MAG: hypothetical protein KatS3mg036_0781 [Ignavibacterium sp.]GIV45980.1 MAG: hypothetical protein KatS3mg036_0798 [Ignavibacterium sp.]
MKELFEIFRYRLLWLNLILVALSIVLMFHYKIISLLAFVLLINLYDILGYHFTLIRRSTHVPDKVIVKAYRVHQLLFEILIAVLIGLIFGWQYSITCAILKWFGLQDLLYYLFLQKQIPDKFTWMKWTPFGIIKGDLSKFEVIFQATIGIIIAILIIIL